MAINTKYRTEEEEIMDDFTLGGEELREALDKIASINQFLGGNKLTLQGVKKLIKSKNEITIVDVGCGNGDMLRALADFGIKNNFKFNLIGIDANTFTINYAIKLSKEYPNISYKCEDIFSEVFSQLEYDIVLCTLTLHHFKNNQIDYLIQLFNKQSKIGIVINDLHRNIIAYRAFQVICFVFRLNRMSREDGLVSILRGFKKQELIEFSERNKLKNYFIQWKWAFRYQWIIKK
ncbi:methyltransferase domain-containing protein [Flavobacterium sp.]|jgi:2-polyprenyl-3-methyl-5-hydroxy-6-metoxy-1,4-benzoquinol methylase|uniref:methyltransferase domain-containing protein n=1 Tax=Flavobacterium sp. TaxID=239 RepID=UPI002A7F6F9D|nr:methyltransferase domain-containing protein [Flavobacterium sp.]